jgi:uncharacterized membrane protein YagU involved in acid resistance
MEGIFQASRLKINDSSVSLTQGIGWGLIGGLAGTLVMDLVLMGLLAAGGLPPLTCFSIVGDTVAGLFSMQSSAVSGSIPLGIAAHYLLGPVIGAIFGMTVVKFNRLRLDSPKKMILYAVVFVEVLSQPLLALTPILLKMTGAETLLWFGGSLVMHLVWGLILGAMMSRGLRLGDAVKTKD